MKIHPWTFGLAAAGVISMASAIQAEEATESVKTLVSSTTLSGYISTSAHWNPGSAAGVGTYRYGGGAGNAKDDGFNLDVVSLAISKPLDEGEWSAGYKAELWFGPDAFSAGGTSGLGNNIAGLANGSSISIKQAYVALRAPVGNGLDFKVGIFDSIIGYETQDATGNPNYTRSWSSMIELTSLTGVLASYRFNDIITATVGVANTYDAVINGRALSGVNVRQSEKTYLGAVKLTAPDSLGFLKDGTLTVGVVDGRVNTGAATQAGGAGPTDPDITGIYVGATIPTPIESVKLGAAWDHLNADGVSDADALAGYLLWQATEKLKLNVRGEYFDPNTVGNTPPNPGASFIAGVGTAAVPTAIEVISATVTVDYALWANVISRLEYRWDHDASGGRHFPGTRNNANLLALNVIYKF